VHSTGTPSACAAGHRSRAANGDDPPHRRRSGGAWSCSCGWILVPSPLRSAHMAPRAETPACSAGARCRSTSRRPC